MVAEPREGFMTSIIPFIGNEVFEAADVKVMSVAYNKATEVIYDFGHPNKIVEQIIAKRIMMLTKLGEHDSDRLCQKALAACRFNPVALSVHRYR
jgi:hypothetical protein